MAREKGTFTSRTKARRRAAEVLFEAHQRGAIASSADLLALLEQRKAFTAAPSPLPAYAIEIVEGVAAARPEVDELLSKHAKGAGLDRIPAVDLAVLRVGAWELLANREQVPAVTAIDEAVAVVKQMSTEDSPAYVNAVLDAARKDLEARGVASAVVRELQVDDTLAHQDEDAGLSQVDDIDDAELLDEY